MDKTTSDTLLHHASLLDQAAIDLESGLALATGRTIAQTIRQASATLQDLAEGSSAAGASRAIAAAAIGAKRAREVGRVPH